MGTLWQADNRNRIADSISRDLQIRSGKRTCRQYLSVQEHLLPSDAERNFMRCLGWRVKGLTNRWSQPLAVVKSTVDFMKRFSVFAALAAAWILSRFPASPVR